MKPGAVLVDIAIDQGGCIETLPTTTHGDPVYEAHGVVHYCVGQHAGRGAAHATYALTNVTVPYALELADQGWREAMRRDPALARGLATHAGQLVSQPVAAAHGMTSVDRVDVLGG